MEHFAFPGNIDFALDSQSAFSCFIHEKLMCLFIVCETVFTIGESRAISHINDTTAAQQVAAIPHRVRFSTEIPLERERRLEIEREQRRRRRQQEIAERREHRLAQRRQRRQQETEEQRNRRLEYPRHSGWKSLPLFFLKCTLELILNTAPHGSNSVNRREKYFNTINIKFQTVQRTHGPVV